MATSSRPHSWPVNDWPAEIYPNDPVKARYLVRAHRDELVAAGALSRVGRELVAIGSRYMKWLEGKTENVPGFECPANRAKTHRAQSTVAKSASRIGRS